MSCMLTNHIAARRHSCAQTSTHPSPFLHHQRRRRDISVSSDIKGQGKSIHKPDVDPAPSRDNGGQQLGPQASDPPEESGNEQPPDQRPMLVRIIMSVFRSFWQSLGRVWEVLPGSKAFRLGFCLFVLALYNVRNRFLEQVVSFCGTYIYLVDDERCRGSLRAQLTLHIARPHIAPTANRVADHARTQWSISCSTCGSLVLPIRSASEGEGHPLSSG